LGASEEAASNDQAGDQASGAPVEAKKDDPAPAAQTEDPKDSSAPVTQAETPKDAPVPEPKAETPKDEPGTEPKAEMPKDDPASEPKAETPKDDPVTSDPPSGNGSKPAQEPGEKIITPVVPVIEPKEEVSSAVWADDFNKIDDARWQIETGGFGSTIIERDGRLEIKYAARSSGSTFGASAVSTCQVSGDFDVEVAYELTVWPPQNGVRVGLNAVAQDGSEIAVERISFGPTEFTRQEEYLVDWGGFFNTVSAEDNLSGKLRMTREDNRVSGFYFDDGDWILIDGSFKGTGDVTLKLGSWSHSNKFVGEVVIVNFDDFVLSQGGLVCSP
jgi:hypothetical protein